MGLVAMKSMIAKDGTEYSIRSAVAEDAAELADLAREIMTEGVYTLSEVDEIDLSLNRQSERIKKHAEQPGSIIILAVLQNKVIGNIDFTNGHRRRIHHQGEFGMSVRDGYRGKGIGEELLKTLIAWGTQNPLLEKINLRTHVTNHRAIALYKKLGFFEEGLQRKDLKMKSGEYVDTLLMGRFV